MSDIETIPNKDLPLRRVPDVRALLQNDQARQQLAAVAAKHLNPERMMRVVANAIRQTPGLQKCEPLSFLGALMSCAALGLEPNSPLGHAYLIPFNKNVLVDGKWVKVPQCQLIIGYKGFKVMAQRTGAVKSMHADVVYSDDVAFSHEYGSNQHLIHKPGPRLGKKLGAYFHIMLKDDAGEGHVYMTGEEILRIRNSAQGWQQAVKDGKTAQSPWTTHEDAMWAKTAVRRLANNGDLPMSAEISAAQAIDEAPMDYRTYALTKLEDLPQAEPMPETDTPEPDEEVVQQEAAKPKAEPKPRATKTKAADPPPAAEPEKTETKPVVKAADKPVQKPVEEQATMDLPDRDPPPQETSTDSRGNPVDEYVDQEAGEVTQSGQADDYAMRDFWRRTVKPDFKDMGFEAAMDLHGEEIGKLKDTNPGFHAFIIAKLAEDPEE